MTARHPRPAPFYGHRVVQRTGASLFAVWLLLPRPCGEWGGWIASFTMTPVRCYACPLDGIRSSVIGAPEYGYRPSRTACTGGWGVRGLPLVSSGSDISLHRVRIWDPCAARRAPWWPGGACGLRAAASLVTRSHRLRRGLAARGTNYTWAMLFPLPRIRAVG